MKIRILLLLASMLLVCFCYYALIHENGFFASKGFLKIRASDVSSITVSLREKTYGFIKGNNGWKLVSPKEHRIDQKFFGMFLRNLTMIPKTQSIAKNPENLRLFGLEDPEIRIKITFGRDKTSTSLLLGNDNEPQTSTYAKIEGRDEVVLLGIILKEDLKRIIDMVDGT